MQLDQYIAASTLDYILITSAIIIAIILVSIFAKKADDRAKALLFTAIAVPTILATLYTAGATIYLNTIAETGGPVHWHADFEIYKCGQSVDLVDPTGLSNRVGTPVFHEHGDNRLHVEGVVVKKEDVSLGKFFEVVGGSLTPSGFSVPTNSGTANAANGELCNGRPAKVQVFAYRVVENPFQRTGMKHEQTKLTEFEGYVPSPYSAVPPGDCIIIEFDAEKPSTDKICETYRIAIERGDLTEA